MTKTELQTLLTEGKTKQILVSLRNIEFIDPRLGNDVILLANQFVELERKFRLNTFDPAFLTIERNRINSAILEIIEILPENTSIPKQNLLLKKIALWLGILLTISILGNMLVNFFKVEKGPNPKVQPATQSWGESNRSQLLIEVPKDTQNDKSRLLPNLFKPSIEEGDVHFINNGKMDKTIIGSRNKIEIH